MISDRDVWAAALLMVKRYGDDAMLEASARADQLLDEGDWQGAATWHRILDAIERPQAQKPAEDEPVQPRAVINGSRRRGRFRCHPRSDAPCEGNSMAERHTGRS